jgi:dihydropyrimidine dehydrogenase (NAD+) subunit PreA
MGKPDLSTNVGGIRSPNPFWLASGPPTNSAYQVRRAFEAGWGGVVWKTLGTEPIVNVSSRYGALDYDHQKMVGLNNIELITDRTLETNLEEIRQVKREYPDHAVVASLMVESKPEVWHDIVRRTQDTGCDGLELNFGCPHGMSERGMGAAVGQVPEYTEQITTWVKEAAEIPVLVKLTPNVTDVRYVGQAAKRGGADGIALINTINSIIGVDLDTMLPVPHVAGRGSHGGYCGPAVKPIALHMVHSIANDPQIGLPISGIGGIQTWRDAVEFMLLGASGVQVCTAAMHYGFRIVEQFISGLENWMTGHGFTSLDDFRGKTVPLVGDWNQLDLSYKVAAQIDQESCVHCGVCYIACEDGAHQSIQHSTVSEDDFAARYGEDGPPAVKISGGVRTFAGGGDGRVNIFEVDQEKCVGCNLCSLVCPVEGCIEMVKQDPSLPSMTYPVYLDKLAKGEVAKIEPPEHS